jgi:tetratricopeptide (TPR) repeat protein
MALVTYRSGRAREQAIQELAWEFERNSWRSETLLCGGWTAQEFVERISKSRAEVLFVLDPDRVLFGEGNEDSPFWISFQRETIVDRPGVQIWWMLPNAAIRFGLELPDVRRFFLFREDLSESEGVVREGLGELEIRAPGGRRGGSVEQGRDLLARALRAGALEADAGRVWLELGIPAIEAFGGAGEIEEAAEALKQISDLVGPPEEALKPLMEKADAGIGRALLVLGNLYGDLGRREEAFARTEEAVDVYRQLAAPGRFSGRSGRGAEQSGS